MSKTVARSWNYKKANELIKINGRTRAWVAQQCGITAQYLGMLLAGKYRPSVAVLKLLATALETTEGELMDTTVAA